MGAFLTILSTGLSTLILAAHFLRRGNLLFVLICLWLLTLLFVRRRWARLVLQVAMVLGALEWAHTLWVLAPERHAAGEPWGRMAVIIGTVGLVAGAAALGLASSGARRRFGELHAASTEAHDEAATP